jgi:hypothetical protein
VVNRVEDLYYLAVYSYGVGDVVGLEDSGAYGLGDGRLAVSRRPVDEQGLPGVDSRSQLFDEVVVHDEVIQAFLETILVYYPDLPCQSLSLHCLDVQGKGHGARARVGARNQGLPYPKASLGGQGVCEVEATVARALGLIDELRLL